MMKKILTITIIVLITVNTFAYFDNFSENPALYASRQYFEFYFPGYSHNVNVYNSLINLSDLSMFEKDHQLTNSEKETLTERDLDLDAYIDFKPLSFGYQNWNLDIAVYGKLNANVLKKKYTEIIFYGNEDEHYTASSGKGSWGISFVKTRASYAYDKSLQLSFIPESITKFKYWDNTVNYVREMPIYVGANLNLYNALAYGEVTKSEQKFGSCTDSTYYNYDMQFIYTDDETELASAVGFGLGFKAKLPEGWFHFSVDDLFAEWEYSNLAGAEYQGTYVDSLLYFDEDYEPFDDSVENDSLRVDFKKVNIKPTIVWGVQHRLYKKVHGLFKYTSSDYKWEGTEFGIYMKPLPWLPLQTSVGFGEDTRWNFGLGIDLANFEYTTAITFMNGLFAKSRGIGVSSGIKFKF
jgi:hypothetical protein